MSDSTWICITPFPLLGWSFGNMVLPRFVSMWQEMFEKTCDFIDCLLENDSMDKIGASTIHYSISITFLVPTSHPSTVPAAHEPGTRFATSTTPTSGYVRARVVTPSLTISPRSPVSVLRSSSTVSWPPFPPSSCRRADDLLRPAAAATSAPPFFLRGSATRRQFDTDTFRAISCRIIIINLPPSVHTYLSSYFHLKHSTEQLAAVSKEYSLAV